MRTFLAINLKSEIREEIKQLIDKISDPACKKVKPENFHLTLKFLGEVDQKQIEPLRQKLKGSINHDKFMMKVEGTGVFPSTDYIKVVWVGASGKFQPLVSQINQTTEEIKQRDHEFHPHITIARVKSKPREKLKQLIKNNQEKRFGSQVVKSFSLMKSELNSEGPVYETLQEFKLGE